MIFLFKELMLTVTKFYLKPPQSLLSTIGAEMLKTKYSHFIFLEIRFKKCKSI